MTEIENLKQKIKSLESNLKEKEKELEKSESELKDAYYFLGEIRKLHIIDPRKHFKIWQYFKDNNFLF
jgi:predicted RNase H-like nuclease (RuvC/YqgF family)